MGIYKTGGGRRGLEKERQDRDVAQLVEGLPRIHKAPGLNSST